MSSIQVIGLGYIGFPLACLLAEKRKISSIDLLSLKKNRIINKNFSKLKILGAGELKIKIDIKPEIPKRLFLKTSSKS